MDFPRNGEDLCLLLHPSVLLSNSHLLGNQDSGAQREVVGFPAMATRSSVAARCSIICSHYFRPTGRSSLCRLEFWTGKEADNGYPQAAGYDRPVRGPVQ
jgi:hypothetical protein